MRGIKVSLRELHKKRYPSLNPGPEPGPGEHMLSTELIDPSSNLIRFFQRGVAE